MKREEILSFVETISIFCLFLSFCPFGRRLFNPLRTIDFQTSFGEKERGKKEREKKGKRERKKERREKERAQLLTAAATKKTRIHIEIMKKKKKRGTFRKEGK